jgi:hypothetical protein
MVMNTLDPLLFPLPGSSHTQMALLISPRRGSTLGSPELYFFSAPGSSLRGKGQWTEGIFIPSREGIFSSI